MTTYHLPIRERLLGSIPFIFSLQFLTALLILIFITHSHRLVWAWALPACFVYSFMVTAILWFYRKKYLQLLELNTTSQLWALSHAVKTTELPNDKTTLKALPVYLERNLRTIERTRKNFNFSAAILTIMLLLSAITHQWPASMLFSFFIALLAYNQFYMSPKQQSRIAVLKSKLDKQGIKTDTKLKKIDSRWQQTISLAPKILLILGVIAGIMFGVLFSVLSNKPTPLPYEFTSSDYGFKINFPTKPSIRNHPPQILSGQNITATTYSSLTSDKRRSFMVIAYKWPAQKTLAELTGTDVKSHLERALNHNIQASSSKMISSKEVNMKPGSTIAEEASFVRESHGHRFIGYIQIFTIKNMEYDVIAQNVNKSSFDNFINSFQSTSSTSSLDSAQSAPIGINGKPPMSGDRVTDANGKPPMNDDTISNVVTATPNEALTVTSSSSGASQSSSDQ